jgi:hypothetical protein
MNSDHEMLRELHSWVSDCNDWRPDSPIARKLRATLNRKQPTIILLEEEQECRSSCPSQAKENI